MAALRELLLAAERSPQPLDDAILSFARSLLLYPPATDTSPPIPPSQDDASSLSRQFLAIHPQGELFLARQQLDAAQAEAFALRVVREKMVQLEKLLSWSDKPWIEFRVLELMAAVTKVSTVTAREFVRVFNFQCPAFVKLATRRWKKSEDEGRDKTNEQHAPVQLRAAYVDLVMALTACPDKSVHRFAMKEGGVTASLFKSVDGDSIEMLTTLFTRLGETVLYNNDVERKSKLVVYNGTCVHQVLALLHVEGDASVRNTALGVLNALFFEDSALYVVPRKQALRLFLSKTTSAHSGEEAITSEEAYAVKVIRNAVATIGVNELLRSAQAQALVMRFLAEYPGFLSEYLAALSLQLEPKPVFRWFCVASIVQKLLSCSLDAMAVGMPTNENQDALQSWCSPQILASRLIAPGNFRKELSRGIQHSSNLVVYSCLCVIEAMLNRFVRVAPLLPSSGFASEVCSELRFLLPSPEALVSLVLKLGASQQRSVALVYVRALTVFRLYMECLPQAMREIKVDFTKMLTWHYLDCPADNSAKGVVLTTPLQSLIVSEILRFLLAIDTSRLRFLFTSGSSDHRSRLQQMLLLYVSTTSLSVQELACQVLRRTLRASDIFGLTTQGEEGHDIAGLANNEVSFWLESLCQGGGKVCALFTEQLACVVMADPLKYVAIGSRVVNAASSSSSLSPITVALVEFLSSCSGVAGSLDLSAYRADKCVVAFAVRILLALMPTSKHPQQLVKLIASNDAFADTVIAPKMHQNEDENICSNSVKNKKRKRSDEILCEGDAYMWLKTTCDALVSGTCKSSNVASRGKGTKNAGTKWHRHSDVNMLTAALVELTPSSFVTSWDHIISNCAEVAANFSPVVHYLSGRGDVDILSLLSRPVAQLVTLSKERRQRQTSDSSPTETFTKVVPLYIVLQHALFRISNRDCKDQDSTIAVMMSVVKGRVENNLLAVTDAARMCEQLLFFFALRNHGFSENGYSRLCELFSNLLTICIVHGENGLTSNTVSRIFFKLQAVISSNASSGSWRQLYAVKIVALRVYSSINPDSNLAALCDFGDLFQRAGVPLVAVLASRAPPSTRIPVLYSLLQHSGARIIAAPHAVLVERVLQSLRNCEMGEHFRSIIVHKRTKLLKQKLWLLLCSESSQRKLPFLMDGFTVLGQLGGVDASTALPFIATSLVPLVVQSAHATSSRNHCTEMVKAMIAALRSGEEVAAFPVIFEEQLWKQIQHGTDQRVVCRLVGALYDVFARVVHPELRQLSDDLIPACYQRVLLKSHEGCTAELALVRHLCTDASSSGNASAFGASLGGALQELASSQCDETLSSSQLLALLFLSRSSGFDDSNAVDLLAILIRSGVGRLKAAQTKLDQHAENECDSLPHDFEATMLMVGSVIRYLQHQVPEKQSLALKLVLPLFAAICEGVRESTSKLAFAEFVILTAALLRLAGNDANAIDYDFAAHFDAVVQHPCFTTSLQNGKNKEVQLLIAQVVAQLVRITGKYTRPLLQILLASYSMSLSPFDRSLRVLFEEFEAQKIDGLTLASMGFRFGASSTILPATALPVSSKGSHNDLVDDSAWVLGGGLEQDRVRATIEHFPLTRTISTTSDAHLLNLDEDFFAGDTGDEAAQALIVDGEQTIEGYDPAFLLPMLSYFISSSDLPDGGIVQQGLLGIAIRATSSDVEDMRKYAFGILAHLHESLQASSETSSDFKAGRQVHLLLDVFRRGIAEELKQVPSLVTVFLNDALAVLTRPTHVLYPQVNHFLLARPAMDVADVPMFYSLFNSRAPLTFRQERSWLLHTLRHGIRTDDDVVLLVRRHVLPMLLSFYASELADTHTQPLITNILIATLDTLSGGVHLVTKTALLAWLAAQFLRYGAVSLSTKSRSDKSIGSTTRPALSALLLPLMTVFEQALRDGIWNALDVTYQRAAALQAANAFACLHTAIVGTKIDRPASSKAAVIATLVVRRAGHVCSLELLLGAVEVVQQNSAKSESACIGLAELVASNLTRWLLQQHHFEARKQRFQDWALLLRQVASVLVSCGNNVVLTKQQRARCSLDQIKSVLDQLPTLKQLVVAPATTNGSSVSAPALF
uniref:Nucleolar pre-ribosomal-associated protein 1 C-terminal domain-containing protein n=1 Tax=Peronospora matthiolae TaxID=2874970 RepID=A0AAV1UPL2_9STRA